MKKFLLLGLFILGLILFFSFPSRNVVLISNFSSLINPSDFTLLFLGKPGPGYIGSENTDSIIVIHYNQRVNKIFLIPIPRDLIVKDDNGNLEKINALYEKAKINLLLKKVSDFTGLKIKNYLAVDLALVTNLVDFFGGIEVDLSEPVTDAVTLYTIPAGRQKLSGYLIELVLRSRYHPEGDFFRMRNQIRVISALKEKIISLNTEEKLALMKFLETKKYYWQTNLSKNELLNLILKISNPNDLKIEPIILTTKDSLLTSGNFNIYNSQNVYGIYPKDGVDNYDKISFYIQSQIKEKTKQ
ncbi:MAG: hypothetical protein KatS3mg096_120 [Candidatus Parcubacteria bacterium]|nr:MAG: hypothetical protein KatS3mg096_120 [Candidatus Parcubacteria bacterium]